MMLDGFDHHDSIVDDDTDREDESEEGEVIQAIPDPVHHRESTDDSDRNSDQWNDASAPGL